MKNSDNYRNRTHCLLLYPDDITHVNALNIIKKSYDYAFALHDKDIQDNGEPKKPHWHVVLRFEQAHWSSAICNDLGISENYIEKSRSFVNSLLYLIHYNDPDKYQYSTDVVQGTLKKRLLVEMSKSDKTECEKILEINDFIKSHAQPLTEEELLEFCCHSGCWSEFRRSATIILRILDKHNLKYKDFR
ncbi:MAG: hypothetical protein IJB84_05910 [Lachnospiraceae bacterium]|nr:hypothetical protein [Lachnospiraceae bacterium]